MKKVLLVAALCAPVAATAQVPSDSAARPKNAAEAQVPPQSPPTPQPSPDAPAGDGATPAEPAAPTLEEKTDAIEGKLTALEEQYAETKGSVLGLSKLKFSGYIQARYSWDQRSTQSADSRGTPRIVDGFSVRRGRLKATYTPAQWTSFVLQIDAVPSGVALRDAEVHLTEPFTGQKLALVAGQTKWPFGYEVVQSSGDREFPERTRVIRAFFPSERDRGAKVAAKFGAVRATVGVFDGNGTIYRTPAGTALAFDNDENKDVVGRVGFDLKWISGGLSGQWGRTADPGNPTATPAVPSGGTFDRNRVGADLQLYLDLTELGGTALKAEFVRGTTWSSGGIEQLGVPAFGWYALLVQNLGLHWQAAVRYDYFDGQLGTPDVAAQSRNGVGTVGALISWFWDESVKLTAVYELPMTHVGAGGTDPADNLFTLQLQAKF